MVGYSTDSANAMAGLSTFRAAYSGSLASVTGTTAGGLALPMAKKDAVMARGRATRPSTAAVLRRCKP